MAALKEPSDGGAEPKSVSVVGAALDALAALAHEYPHMSVLAVAASLVGVTAVLVCCKVCKCCWLRNHCPLRAKYRSDPDYEEKNEEYDMKVYDKADLAIHQQRLKNTLSPRSAHHQSRVIKQHGLSPRGPGTLTPANYSPAEVAKYGSTISVSSNNSNCGTPTRHRSFAIANSESDPGGLGPNAPNVVEKRSELDFALHYNEIDSKLAIYIKCARNLPPNLHGTASDCILRIVLVRDLKRGWMRKHPSNLSVEDVTSPSATFDTVEFRTQQQRRALNPVFNEYFSADLREKDRRYATLKVAVCSVDRDGRLGGGRLTVQSECHISLAKARISELSDYTLPLTPYRPDLGEVMITLSYLPTAERLCCTIVKAAHLKLPLSCGPSLPNVLVKGSLIQRGKLIGGGGGGGSAKQRTSVVWESSCPEFRQVLTFDLPQNELERVTLVLTIEHQEPARNTTATDAETDGGGNTTSSSGGLTVANGAVGGTLSDDGIYPVPPVSTNWKPGVVATSGGGALVRSRRKSVGNMLDNAGERDSSPPPGTPLSKSRSTSHVSERRRVRVGRLALGSAVTTIDGTERSHWREMCRSPRTQITHWHKLIP